MIPPPEGREESPPLLPSLRCTDFELEPIQHPGRQAVVNELVIISPQKRQRVQLYPTSRRAGTKPNRKQMTPRIQPPLLWNESSADSNSRPLSQGEEDRDIVRISPEEFLMEVMMVFFNMQKLSKVNVSDLSDFIVSSLRWKVGGRTKGKEIETGIISKYQCYYTSYEGELQADQVEEGTYPTIILFLKESLDFEGNKAVHLFSVSSSDEAVGISHWAIVKHEGSDRGEG
ncbi:hypothetical protein GYMLUDRAFT_248797 [Collybiopsis luxurians FD-317 M1]|uniref:Uncharacterized protein n=1 Tax=Collybiopsis luxurians FD-317 M1 TaxID=944289 RepID=A0A0D0CAX3_9AGAR|nr:hypothetical protein GYMLUDRAFT_248797 [Collybiopsis luxurians FD-317 M1]